MKFSIITCTWNSAATLPQTIASVQAQRGVEVEHVFVDGGSTDGTLEQITSMAPQALVLRNVRGGISRAMNEGIKAATGDVIAHLHSDDYYCDEQVLSDVAAALDGGLFWLVGRIDVLKDDRIQHVPANPTALTRSSYTRGAVSIPHPAVFIRRQVFQQQGMFDESLRYAMDIDLWMRLLPVYQPLQLNRTLAVFREHAGSVSTANVLAAREEEFRVRQRYAGRHPLDALIYRLRFMRRMRRLRRQLAEAAQLPARSGR